MEGGSNRRSRLMPIVALWHKDIHNVVTMFLATSTSQQAQLFCLKPPQRPNPYLDDQIKSQFRSSNFINSSVYFSTFSVVTKSICDSETLTIVLTSKSSPSTLSSR